MWSVIEIASSVDLLGRYVNMVIFQLKMTSKEKRNHYDNLKSYSDVFLGIGLQNTKLDIFYPELLP